MCWTQFEVQQLNLHLFSCLQVGIFSRGTKSWRRYSLRLSSRSRCNSLSVKVTSILKWTEVCVCVPDFSFFLHDSVLRSWLWATESPSPPCPCVIRVSSRLCDHGQEACVSSFHVSLSEPERAAAEELEPSITQTRGIAPHRYRC